jgi:hypothetical protein
VREEVAGDLYERYRSPARYLADLARTLPHVIMSQLRRGTDPVLFLLVALTLIVSLGGIEPARGAAGVPIPLRALAGALPCLAVLLLRNAYRGDETWSAARATGDAAWLALSLLLTQAAVALAAPGWRLPLGWLIGGFTFTAIVTALLRAGIELVNTGLRPGLATVPDPAADFGAFRRNLRLRATIETSALALPVGVATWFALTAERPLVSFVAEIWAGVTLSLIAHRWAGGDARTLPDNLSAQQSLSRYISELERQRAQGEPAWWWYFAPLFAGILFNTVAFGIAGQQPLVIAAGLAACAALSVLIVRAGTRRRVRLSDKIAQLQRSAAQLPA